MVKFVNLFFIAIFGLSITLNAYAINSNSIIKQTNLSSITANEVNINAKGNTHLKGSMIASGNYESTTDENGNTGAKFIDNGNLNLSTNSLTFENLANTSYNKGSNFNIGVNYSLANSNSQNQNSKNSNTDPNSKITSANYANSRNQGYSASKTLATIGQGNLQISDTTNSDDLDRLNRNTDEINKDLYSTSISSNIDASIDTRLFTADGREQIKQDLNDLRQGLGKLALQAILGDEAYKKSEVINNELAKLKETDPQKYKEISEAIIEYNNAINEQENNLKQDLAFVIPAIPAVLSEFFALCGITAVAGGTAYTAKKLGDKYRANEIDILPDSSFLNDPLPPINQEQQSIKDNILTTPQAEQDNKITNGGVDTNNPFNKPYIGGVQGQEQNFKDNVIYANKEYTTPDMDKSEFEKVKGSKAYKKKEDGTIWVKDLLHKDHWEVYKDKKSYEKGKRSFDVWEDGRFKGDIK